MRGDTIRKSSGHKAHDAGAYGRCSKCGSYSDDSKCLYDDYRCSHCKSKNSFSGSFIKPSESSIWEN